MLNLRANRPLRVLYDLRWMRLGVAGGVEQATYELVDAIGRFDRKNSYRILAPRSACWEWSFPEGFQVSRHYADEGAQATGLDFDLVHSTCSYIHPDMLDRPGVLTVHDLQHMHHPEFFTVADLEDRARLYGDSAARAAHIICISEYTRRDVHERMGVPLERMTTVWDIPSSSAWRELPARECEALLAGMGVRRPFLLYPAQPWLHKNHERLLRAFAAATAQIGTDAMLVLTGRPFGNAHPAAPLLAGNRRAAHLGFRSPLEMRALLQGCTALVFPSLFEGFGMPVAEAIIAGTPIACSNVTSLPEIAGDAAIFFDPYDVDDMARAMVRIAADAELRAKLAQAAAARRALFSPQACALKTLAVYERAFAQTRA